MKDETLSTIIILSVIIIAAVIFISVEYDKAEQNITDDTPQPMNFEPRIIKTFGFSQDAIEINIGCKTNSMHPTLKCGDKLILRNVSDKEKLIASEIYIYRYNNTKTIIHRLIKCLKDSCIFKGDNNLYADKIVNRSNVLYKLIGVRFE